MEQDRHKKTVVSMIEQIHRLYCQIFHRSIMWAGGKTYECRTCGEVFDSCIHNPKDSRESEPQNE